MPMYISHSGPYACFIFAPVNASQFFFYFLYIFLFYIFTCRHASHYFICIYIFGVWWAREYACMPSFLKIHHQRLVFFFFFFTYLGFGLSAPKFHHFFKKKNIICFHGRKRVLEYNSENKKKKDSFLWISCNKAIKYPCSTWFLCK